MNKTNPIYNAEDGNYLFEIMASKLDAIAGIIPLELKEVKESRVLYARFDLLRNMITSIANEARHNARGFQTEEEVV